MSEDRSHDGWSAIVGFLAVFFGTAGLVLALALLGTMMLVY